MPIRRFDGSSDCEIARVILRAGQQELCCLAGKSVLEHVNDHRGQYMFKLL